MSNAFEQWREIIEDNQQARRLLRNMADDYFDVLVNAL